MGEALLPYMQGHKKDVEETEISKTRDEPNVALHGHSTGEHCLKRSWNNEIPQNPVENYLVL